MTKSLTILGSTGSIGESALRVVSANADEYRVHALACGSNLGLLDRQIDRYRPDLVAVESPARAGKGEFESLKKKYPRTTFLSGPEGVIEAASSSVDIVLSAIAGAAGLRPTLAALKSCSRIALANKETLVMAGSLVMDMARRNSVEIVPVDSEHSAIFSLLRNVAPDEVERIVLTASGGSLRHLPLDELNTVTPEMALAHPTWDMGSKITIDSATLMNKGLEVIEAHHLFSMDYDRISVIIHPESIIHSMVETLDGALYAHMGVPDMALPILGAFSHPYRRRNAFGRLAREEIGQLRFVPVDPRRYPALGLCLDAGRAGGTMPAFLSGSNEVAVETFLKKKVRFTARVRIVERAMARPSVVTDPDIEAVFAADREAREITRTIIDKEI
jgi:1-deoxy-D-xylulose-5-phosphate reductoisomerase